MISNPEEYNKYTWTDDGQMLSTLISRVLDELSGYKCGGVNFDITLQGGHKISFVIGKTKKTNTRHKVDSLKVKEDK